MVRQGRYTKKVSTVKKAKRSTRRHWRWFSRMSLKKKIAVIATPIVIILGLIPLFTYAYYYNDIADQERLMNRNNTGIVLTDTNGKVFYETGRAEHRELTGLGSISDNVEHALVAAEDKDFYKHEGFSITGIIRALYGNIVARGVTGGGSTITQQLAKNTLLTEQQTFLRKYQELTLSLAIEQRYSKDQIMEMYLNSAFFGGNIFGIEDAAQAYFGKSAKDLDLAQASMLIGILPAPNAYSPTLGNPKYATERQNTVLSRMVTNGYITAAEKAAAQAGVLAYQPMSTTGDNAAPHFTEMVLNELYDKFGGEEKVTRSGYQVKTTLDLTLQQQLTDNIAKHISYIQRNGGSNASGVAIDPTTGEVRALVGSADWNNSDWGKVNIVTTPRQPGSSFKPIYYSRALADNVITPATMLDDVATDFGGGYKPKNATNSFYGKVSVRNALAWSLNIPSVKVMQKLGISASIEQAKQLGITTIDSDKNYGLPLALGSAEVPLLQMTNAYAAFANQGQQYSPTIVKQINNKFDDNIFKAKETAKTAISKEGAFLISSILSDNNARARIFGSSLTVPGKTAAVKTGTTDENRDAWTIGYTPQLAIGVWVGNNNNQVMQNGGSGMAGPIWVNTMRQALSGVADTKFTIPSGITQRSVCYSNGGLASSSGNGTYNEYFLAWGLPTETCTPVVEPPKQPEKPKEEDQPSDEEEDNPNPDDEDPNTDPNDGNNGNGNGSGVGNTTPTIPDITP